MVDAFAKASVAASNQLANDYAGYHEVSYRSMWRIIAYELKRPCFFVPRPTDERVLLWSEAAVDLIQGGLGDEVIQFLHEACILNREGDDEACILSQEYEDVYCFCDGDYCFDRLNWVIA